MNRQSKTALRPIAVEIRFTGEKDEKKIIAGSGYNSGCRTYTDGMPAGSEGFKTSPE